MRIRDAGDQLLEDSTGHSRMSDRAFRAVVESLRSDLRRPVRSSRTGQREMETGLKETAERAENNSLQVRSETSARWTEVSVYTVAGHDNARRLQSALSRLLLGHVDRLSDRLAIFARRPVQRRVRSSTKRNYHSQRESPETRLLPTQARFNSSFFFRDAHDRAFSCLLKPPCNDF